MFEFVVEFDVFVVVIIKHINPVGCVQGDDVLVVYEVVFESDLMSVFGGIVMFNCLFFVLFV